MTQKNTMRSTTMGKYYVAKYPKEVRVYYDGKFYEGKSYAAKHPSEKLSDVEIDY